MFTIISVTSHFTFLLFCDCCKQSLTRLHHPSIHPSILPSIHPSIHPSILPPIQCPSIFAQNMSACQNMYSIYLLMFCARCFERIFYSKFSLQFLIIDCCKQSLTRLHHPPIHPPTHPSSPIRAIYTVICQLLLGLTRSYIDLFYFKFSTFFA